MKTQLILIALMALALTGCSAAETNDLSKRIDDLNERFSRHAANAVRDAVIDSLNSNTWANVRGGVQVRYFTNSTLEDYKLVSGENRGDGVITNGVFVPSVTRIRIHQMPVQVVRWFNDISNVWETVEVPLIQPRLVSETLRTNVVKAAK